MNKTNLELKHYCSDFSKIRLALKQLGATKEVIKNQKNKKWYKKNTLFLDDLKRTFDYLNTY